MSDHGISAWTRGYKEPPRKSTRSTSGIPYKHSEHEFPDYLSQEGAKLLVARITTYWNGLGFGGLRLTVERVQVNYQNGQCVYAIKSNMVRGIPPR